MILPLSRHDFRVRARDVDAGVQAGLVMRLNHISPHDLASANTAIVRSLGSWEAVLWPAIWITSLAQHGVFLLKAKPELVFRVLLHQDGGVVAEIVRVWLAIGHPRLGHDEDVVAQAEGVGIHGNGTEIDIGIVSGSLLGRGTVKVPFWEVIERLRLLVQGLIHAIEQLALALCDCEKCNDAIWRSG